jgi:transcriptional regulator with XRE-family HTH domain
VNTSKTLWEKLRTKKYREELVASQVKRGIPFQIRSLMKQKKLSQETLAERAGLSQGVVSRAANPNYGNLTLNTIIKIAAGFDVAFVGKFVPFSDLDEWFTSLSPSTVAVKSFDEEDRTKGVASGLRAMPPTEDRQDTEQPLGRRSNVVRFCAPKRKPTSGSQALREYQYGQTAQVASGQYGRAAQAAGG